MGNSIRGGGLLRNIGDCPFYVQLGSFAAIQVTGRMVEETEDGGYTEKWTVSYNVDGSTCSLDLTKFVGPDGKVNWVFFDLRESICPNCGLHLAIQRTESDHLQEYDYRRCNAFNSIMSVKSNRTTNNLGGVTDTCLHLYGNGNKGGLLVMEWKKKGNEDAYDTLTVAHYYAHSNGSYFNRNKIDVGLSVVARIRANGGTLDLTVEGPEQHPPNALFYMFDEVYKSGVWKPLACLHCANLKKQRNSSMFQSESEDSDSIPIVPRRGSGKGGRGVGNDGAFLGNGNGNFYERNIMVFKGKSRYT